MEQLDNILELVLLFAAGIVSPGPSLTLIIKYSLSYSRKSGILASLGIACGVLFHAIYISLGIGAILISSKVGMKMLYLFGGTYLAYIGYMSIRTTKKSISLESYDSLPDISSVKAFSAGFLACTLNPKAVLLTSAILTSIVDIEGEKNQYILYMAIMFLEAFIWYSIVTLFLSSQIIRTKARKIEILITRITGSILFLFGVKLIFEGI